MKERLTMIKKIMIHLKKGMKFCFQRKLLKQWMD